MAECILKRGSIESSSTLKAYDFGTITSGSVDVKTALPSKYSTLTANNFHCYLLGGGSAHGWEYYTTNNNQYASLNFSKSYDATTGLLTFSVSSSFYLQCAVDGKSPYSLGYNAVSNGKVGVMAVWN